MHSNSKICLVCKKGYKGTAVCCGLPTVDLSTKARIPSKKASKKEWIEFSDRFLNVHNKSAEMTERIISFKKSLRMDVSYDLSVYNRKLESEKQDKDYFEFLDNVPWVLSNKPENICFNAGIDKKDIG